MSHDVILFSLGSALPSIRCDTHVTSVRLGIKYLVAYASTTATMNEYTPYVATFI
ncbi:hypothetical protein ECTA8571_11470 [Escherichia coli]|nr:hypothetical protein ECTA8571_11470 [Escherichia coli]